MSLHCGLSFELAACVRLSMLSPGGNRKFTRRADLQFRFARFHGWYAISGGFVPSSAAFELKSAAINNGFACQSLLYLASRC